jgi:hypothetical protein
MDFCVRRVVWNREQYNLLVATREKWEIDESRTWRPEPGFFPAYRAELLVDEPDSPLSCARVRSEE